MPDRPRQVGVFFMPSSYRSAQLQWRPAADVYRTRTGWLLKFDLAGVRPEDVTVRAKGCRITVSGTRRDWTVQEVCGYHSMEISYNRFERTIELPCELNDPQITMEFRDGILLIRVTTER